MMYADAEDVRLVILVEQAERLKETLPDLVVPLTRLAELVRAIFRFYIRRKILHVV